MAVLLSILLAAAANEPDFSFISKPRAKQVDGILWFHTDGCEPCNRMMPMIMQMATRYYVWELHGVRDRQKAEAWRVTAYPTTIIYRNGRERWRRVGVATEQEIRAAWEAAGGR